jgi:hypothetical protein
MSRLPADAATRPRQRNKHTEGQTVPLRDPYKAKSVAPPLNQTTLLVSAPQGARCTSQGQRQVSTHAPGHLAATRQFGHRRKRSNSMSLRDV